MADAVSSAVVQHTVSQILSGLVQKYEEKYESDVNRNLERLEMAHIRLEAALETSCKWHITDRSLLRWRKKLKCAAQECDDTLHKWKQRILEDEQIEQEVSNSSLPNRIVHATKSFVISVLTGKNELSSSVVERFEWFAAGASEFLRFVELGGTPRRHIAFRSLVKNLFAGKELHYKNVQGDGHLLFRLWMLPFSTTEHGIEATLILIQNDSNEPGVTIYFSIVLQLSESTDIVGIAIKCLHLFAPPFNYAIKYMSKELIQLHTSDISSWVSPVYSCQKEYYDLHMLGSQWFRPNPLCCKQQNRSEFQCISNSGIVGLSDISLEPVNEVTFETFLSGDIISLQDAPSLKAGILFAPHRSLKSILPAHKGSAVLAVVGKEKCCLHKDITMEELKEIILPKAMEYFHQNVDATVYQMIWRSKHGYALIYFEKANMNTTRISMGTRGSFGESRKRNLLQLQGKDQELKGRTRMAPNFFDLWGSSTPIKLQSFFMDWTQKEKESQFAAQQLRAPEIPSIVWMIRETQEE
ncbi:hypothetical protein QOZ80_7AG0553850 [Eleusine coracana subsp. coracana]|nr:hypothetical protein QOZ80_7AG0553850 [Eleusine coracana subsp. coracana]